MFRDIQDLQGYQEGQRQWLLDLPLSGTGTDDPCPLSTVPTGRYVEELHSKMGTNDAPPPARDC